MIQSDIPQEKGCAKGGESYRQHAAAKHSKFNRKDAPCPSPSVTHTDIFPEQLKEWFLPRKKRIARYWGLRKNFSILKPVSSALGAFLTRGLKKKKIKVRILKKNKKHPAASRPHVECCIQSGDPQYQKDTDQQAQL